MVNVETRGKIRYIVITLILINLGLFLVKWIPSVFFRSVSLEADAFNSFGDFVYSILFLLGLEWALKPKDKSHPHGHERIEPFLSLSVAVAIFATGVYVVRHAIVGIYDPVFSFSPFFIVSLVISASAKVWLSFFLRRKGEEMDSTALISSGRDARTDVLASLTALTGVFFARFGVVLLDSVFGLVVSIWIFKTAYEIGKESFGYLIGAAPSDEVVKEVEDILKSNDLVISYHDLEAHYVGPKVHISLSLHLPPDLDFDQVHRVEESLKDEIKNLDEVDSIYIHMEPDPLRDED